MKAIWVQKLRADVGSWLSWNHPAAIVSGPVSSKMLSKVVSPAAVWRSVLETAGCWRRRLTTTTVKAVSAAKVAQPDALAGPAAVHCVARL